MGVLGVDTSCYRTSLAFVRDGAIVSDQRILLSVKQGERGLRQSEGLFQHIQNLPLLAEKVRADMGSSEIEAVCVSTKPRPLADSYMPVFTAGYAFAKGISEMLRVPLIETSHQQGHVRAALYRSDIPKGEFLAVHLSGGTTEVLKTDVGLSITLLGGSKDLHAGQLVDRVGVKLGAAFPAGPELEKMAQSGTLKSLVPTCVDGVSCNLSGAEAQLMRLIEGGTPKEDVAMEVYSFLARTLCKMLVNAQKATGVKDALLAGGVCASGLLKTLLRERIEKSGSPLHLHWAIPAYSGDNAVGVALIGGDTIAKRGNAAWQ